MCRREIYRKAELTEEKHLELIAICKNLNVEFLTSIFNIKHLKFLESLNMEAIKIPSHEIYNTELIGMVQSKFKRVLRCLQELVSLRN